MSFNKTPNLNLPQYEGHDKFDLKEINNAYSSIDRAYAEVIDARSDKETLSDRLNEFDERLGAIENNFKLFFKHIQRL